MARTIVVTGSASGIGAATAALLRRRGERVIGCDLRDAEIIADLSTESGRDRLAESVATACGGHLDAVVANAGGGGAETMVQLNFFGAVATLARLRDLLAGSPSPRAVAVSSIACLQPCDPALEEACLDGDEPAALIAAQALWDRSVGGGTTAASLALYGTAKHALNAWCRRNAVGAEWAGAGILLNAVALGFYDTPAAAYILGDAQSRAAMEAMVPLRGAFPGRPEEAAHLLAWLVGPENTQLTGQVLFADGGLEARAAASAA